MKKKLAERVGEQLRHAREKRGLSQEQLDLILGGTGTNSSIARREKGTNAATLDTVERHALALGYEVEIVLKPIGWKPDR